MSVFRAIASTFLLIASASASAATAAGFDTLPSLTVLPSDYVQISVFVPRLGEHYGTKPTKALPTNAIYDGYKGKIIGVEWILTPEQFAAHQNWDSFPGLDLPGLPAVDHLAINYDGEGLGSWKQPLYYVRLFYVSQSFLDDMVGY